MLFFRKMRIACLMKDFGMNYKINKIYCDNHGIDLLVVAGSSEKWSCLLKELERGEYDYVIWMGSDAHFYVDSPELSAFISDFGEKHFLYSGDFGSGVLIVKNSLENMEWLKGGSLDAGLGVCFEHGILEHFEEKPCLKNPYHMYGYPFVVRYDYDCSCGEDERVEKSRKYYMSLSCL